MTQAIIGIDISKDHLDVHRLPGKREKRFPNDRAGHRALIKWLAGGPVERIVYEATGPYHRAFEHSLGQAGLPLARINPRQARRFAEATGKLAKTDRADAAMLARFGRAVAPPTRTPGEEPVLEDLKDLHGARRALVKDRTAAMNRQKHLRLPLLTRHALQRLKQIETQLEAIDQAIDDLIAHHAELAARLEILTSIPGVAKLSAYALLTDMPELGTLEAKQAAALAGLAPVTKQSGTWSGRASIKGGRAPLRHALYMPALVATRFNPDLKKKYQQLTKAGKPPKVAITAVMRKLVILANALIRDQRKWTQNPA